MLRRSSFVPVAASLLLACAGPHPTSQPVTQGPSVERTRQRLDALVQVIEGTRADRLAGELLTYHRYQDGLVRCMADEGFEYAPPAFVDPTLALPDPILLQTEWLDPISSDFGLPAIARASTLVGEAQLAAENAPTPFLSLSAEDQDAFSSAMETTCDTADQQPAALATFPPSFARLGAASTELVERVSATFDDRADTYRACMNDQGVPLETTRMDGFVGYLYSAPPYPTADGGDEVDAWNAWVADVHGFASADAVCRSDIYEEGMGLLAPLLDAFEADHADEIARIAQEWDEMVAAASDFPEFAASLQVERPTWPGWDGTA